MHFGLSLFLETSKSNPSFPNPPQPWDHLQLARPWTVSPACVESQEQQLPPRWWRRCGETFWWKKTKGNTRKQRLEGAQNQKKDIYVGCWVVVFLWKCESFVPDEWVVCLTLLSSVSWHSRAFFGTSRLPGNRRPGSGTWRVRTFRISPDSGWCFAVRFSMHLS